MEKRYLRDVYWAAIEGLEFAQAIQAYADACLIIVSDTERAHSVFGEPMYYGYYREEGIDPDEIVAVYLLIDALFYLYDLQRLVGTDHVVVITRSGWLKRMDDPNSTGNPVLTVEDQSYRIYPADITHFIRHGKWPI